MEETDGGHNGGHTAGLAAMVDNPEVLPSEKMHHLLFALRDVRAEREEKAAPIRETIEDFQAKMAKAIEGLDMQETEIKAAIEDCLLHEFKDDDCKYEGKVGMAKIIRPSPSISYDKKGLETLRLSSDEMERIIGHLRTVKTRDPYLRVKLTK